MKPVLAVRNRQRTRALDLARLRRITRLLLTAFFGIHSYELGIHVVSTSEIARLNERFLNHPGPTDVITFNHQESLTPIPAPHLHGELFICIEEAVRQAHHYGVTWQEELVRYLIHGILHLTGYDDRDPENRKRMKRVESRLLRRVGRRVSLAALAARNRCRGSFSRSSARSRLRKAA